MNNVLIIDNKKIYSLMLKRLEDIIVRILFQYRVTINTIINQ